MTDAEFVAAFEDCSLAEECFHHRDHIRLAWIYLREMPLLDALARYSAALRRYAASRGKPDRYHQTITFAFLLLIQERRRPGDTWRDFEAANDDLFAWNPSILSTYYRPETLASVEARQSFVLPDYEVLR
ncbi:MAG: hypothetical protein ACXVIJ_01715 [Thermoanaerobaculia bacterium]